MKKLILLAIFLCSGCAINHKVDSVDAGTTINKIYIQENEAVLMKELINELVGQIEEIGFSSESYKGTKPVDATHHMTYTANWQWDMAMYLTYFRATLYEGSLMLGEVEYDATAGGMNLGKFGKTAEKIRPLLEQLLADVNRPQTIPAAAGNAQ